MPIEDRHLAGAANLLNFVKSAVAVSLSKKDPDKRYIKHIKCRNGRKLHGEENVAECTITKDGANLIYELNGFGPERDHLEIKDISEVLGDIMDTIVDERKGGASFRSISKTLQSNYDVEWSHTTIMRKLKDWNKNENIHNEEVDVSPDKPQTAIETRVTIS